MAKQRPLYPQRHFLRHLEQGWSRLEGWLNRFSSGDDNTRPYNPLYHLGTLTIFLLIFLTATGIYLTIFYRPGTDRAFFSVAGISATWIGSLMRTAHRYASNGLIVVTLLHALKMLFSDRFWESRWLAWLSGWVMLVLFWVIGLMGYWLVWDKPAQWLTEYFIYIFRGSFAYTFFHPDVASTTFSLFVIILFLHIFLPILLVVGIVIHVLRLNRAQYWSPRWLMIMSVITLVIVALLRPAAVSEPADLSQLVNQTIIDWSFMGFLPLTALLSNPLFWGLSLTGLGFITALPWLRRGQNDGPAIVIPGNCTGCAVCARECPYQAIEMVHRDDESPYNSIAIVKPPLCTGCGICVGACPDTAIELDRLHSAVMRQDLRRTLAQAQADGRPAITVFACERHAALGTLPELNEPEPIAAPGLAVGGAIPLLRAKLPPRVNVGAWPDSQGKPHPVLTCVVPCTGMIHPNWAAESIEAGGAGAIVVACPAYDCSYREGPHWIADRLKRRRTFRRGNTHFLELAPGSRQVVSSLWSLMIGDEAESAKARQAGTVVGPRQLPVVAPSIWSRLRSLGVGLAVLFVVFLVSLLLDQPATAVSPEQGLIRLAINHGGQLIATTSNLSDDVLARLPENVDPTQVLGGQRYPVHLRLEVDGQVVLEQTYEPRGLRQEGSIYGLETWWAAPGEHDIIVRLMDDETTWREVFSDRVSVAEGGVVDLWFSKQAGVFLPR